VGVILVVQRGSDAEVTEEYGTVIVDEEIRCFDIPVNKAVDMEIIEALEGLLEDATDDLLLHATGPCIVHDVGGTSCVHESESDV
jgi:hypothetical protein